MSKERARRREVRIAETQRRIDAERRRNARRSRSRALRSRLLPRRRRVGRLAPKYSRGQRKIALAVVVALGALTFYLTPSWPVRIAVLVVCAIAFPVLLTVSFDRRTR
jgi:preprotein translocase subunit SecF